MHDKTLLEEESKESQLPQKIWKLFDLAFFGLDEMYDNAAIPMKKTKGKELSEKQKYMNLRIS